MKASLHFNSIVEDRLTGASTVLSEFFIPQRRMEESINFISSITDNLCIPAKMEDLFFLRIFSVLDILSLKSNLTVEG